MFKSNSVFTVLYTTDVKLTHAFFQGLGFAIKELAADKVVVVFDKLELHFILDTSEPFAAYNYIAVPEKYGQGVIFYIETTEIQQLQEKITKLGGQVKASIFENLWGYQEILFEDPNGYKFAAYQELGK